MRVTPLSLQDCAPVARLHQAMFFRGWNEKDFKEFVQDPHTFGLKIELLQSQNRHAELVSASKKRSRNKFGMTNIDEETTLCGYILWREIAPEAEILTLVIAPDFQRKGMGGELITELFKQLEAKKIEKLFLEVAADNESAQSFYTHHGFVFVGKRPNYYQRKDNVLIEAWSFVKEI